MLKYFDNTKRNFLEKIIAIIGKASYHIFLMQLVYYSMLEVIIFNNKLDYILHIFICLTVGILSYYLESKLDYLLDFKKLKKL